MSLQIFGFQKCQTTRKAERFLKERGVEYHFVDLKKKAMSSRELENIAIATGWDTLLNKESHTYIDQGLKYLINTDPKIKEYLLKDTSLINTPIVRKGSKACVGYQPELWKEFV